MTRTNTGGPPSPADDPYQRVIDDIGLAREGLLNLADALARRQDDIGALRAQALQKPPEPPATPDEQAAVTYITDVIERLPDEAPLYDIALAAYRASQRITDGRTSDDVLADVIGVLWPDYPGAAGDAYCTEQAKAAILATRSSQAAAIILAAANQTRRWPRGARQELAWREAARLWTQHLVEPGAEIPSWRYADEEKAGQPAGTVPCCALFTQQYGCASHGRRAPAPYVAEPQCVEVRYDVRGDCDGPMRRAVIARLINGIPAGTVVDVCQSHFAQCVGEGEMRDVLGVG
jgi:hypothetical protein